MRTRIELAGRGVTGICQMTVARASGFAVWPKQRCWRYFLLEWSRLRLGASTRGGTKAGLIAPVMNAQPGIVAKEDGGYKPPRSPSFYDSTCG